MQHLVPFRDVAKELSALSITINSTSFGLLITMFEWSEEEGRYMSAHHPFTLPQARDRSLELEVILAKVRAIAMIMFLKRL